VPRLRFTRDERGYEHTFLVHTTGRRGRERSRVLYWFRSPPAVRVGRPALDSAAIRAIEEANPGIAFDWPTILEARPAESEPPEGWRARRARPTPATPALALAPRVRTQAADDAEEQGSATGVESPTASPAPPFEGREPEGESDGDHIERSAVHRALGSEGLLRVRARYAEVLARISSQVTDAAVGDELRVLAERLNPDAWVTDEEVRRGLEDFEPVLETVRQRLGRPRRRRARSALDTPVAAGDAVDAPTGPAAAPDNPQRPAD
jgi:hypothetical protein